ncbi:MAG: hypothetical protein HW383_778 [Candidatus Magasanikbacteria bacterium]|nr:hypothetical protein [Candidatus Magasanikbacteria bacterium]
MKKILIIGVALLAVLAIIAAVVIARRAKPAADLGPAAVKPAALAPAPTPAPIVSDVSFGKATPVEKAQPPAVKSISAEDAGLLRLAALYGSQFGTYTTALPFQNLRDLLPNMTAAMSAWANGVIADAAPLGEPTTVITRVLTTNVSAKDTNKISFALRTQRQVMKNTAPAVIQYQTLNLSLEQSVGVWRLASAVWAE